MPVTALHHFTIRCTPLDLPRLVDFYTQVMRLESGDRPELPSPGAWLYTHGEPIVHLYAHLSTADSPVDPATGPLDHIAFRSHDLVEMRSHLAGLGIPFTEAPVPGRPLHQVFIHDPLGLRIEMTFWLDNEARSQA